MVWSYSSDQFFRDWRFSIERDFVDSFGKPFVYAENGLQQWGDEQLSVPYPDANNKPVRRCVAISDDGKYVAINADFDVDVVDVENFKHVYSLKGHVSQIDCIAFRPGSSNQLVSAAMNDYAGSRQAEPQVIFWDLNTQNHNILTSPEILERLSRNAANSIIADIKFIDSDSNIGSGDQRALANAVKDPITLFLRAKNAADNPKIFGRILENFGSQVFSQSGKTLIYLPGRRPNSNGDDDWELRTYSVEQQKDLNVFSGHRDSIVWAGFNPDETLLGTAAWDGTFRIWDASNGKTKHLFLTGMQNWEGAFSPDGKFFAGTDGGGTLHIYNLSDGSEYMNYKHGNAWARALAWHPNSEIIALGTEDAGKLLLIDVNSKEVLQERMLTTKDMKVPEEYKKNLRTFIGVVKLAFVDKGRKLVFFTSGDGSAEVYDLEEEEKWRFARAGTMNPPDDDSEVTSKGGFDMVVSEDRATGTIKIVTADGDSARVWSIPTASEDLL